MGSFPLPQNYVSFLLAFLLTLIIFWYLVWLADTIFCMCEGLYARFSFDYIVFHSKDSLGNAKVGLFSDGKRTLTLIKACWRLVSSLPCIRPTCTIRVRPSMCTSLLRKSAPMVALKRLLKRLLTYWFIRADLPTLWRRQHWHQILKANQLSIFPSINRWLVGIKEEHFPHSQAVLHGNSRALRSQQLWPIELGPVGRKAEYPTELTGTPS